MSPWLFNISFDGGKTGEGESNGEGSEIER